MTYWLGIDLGTTYTAAALCRPVAGELETRVVPLGNRSPAIPSVLFLAPDGSLLVGEAAEQHTLTEPDRVVREFKRRIGDEIPLLVGGRPWPAHELAGVLVHWVWQVVNDREAELPEGIALTCPASWGPYKISLFEQAVEATRIGQMTRLGRVQMLSEPQAAAIGYASGEQVEVGARLAVYDLGGGTFDAAVVRKDSPTEFTFLGRPEGIDDLGGVTFDEMLFQHVCAAAGVPLGQIDPEDPRIVPEVARLRRECTEAKELLSVDTDATIAVALGGVRQRIRVTRAEFEEMIRPELDRTIETLHRALESAGVDGTQLDGILLAGGSSRIPLVSQLISAEFGRAPAIEADPKTTVAVGAARFPAPEPASWAAPVPRRAFEDSVDTDFRLPPIPPERPQMVTMLSGDEAAPAEPGRPRPRLAIVAAGAVVLVGAVAATVLGTHKLADEPSYSAASPAATQSASRTPTPKQSARLTGADPRSSRTPASSAAPPPPPVQGAVNDATSPAIAKTVKSTPKPTPTHTTPSPTPQTTSPSPTPTRTFTYPAPPSGPPTSTSSSPPPSTTTATPTGTGSSSSQQTDGAVSRARGGR